MSRPLTSPMPRPRLAALREIGAMPMFPALLATLLLIGLRDAMTAPYLVLLAIEHAHLAPVPLGLFLTARAAGAILFGILFGAWFDRAPTLRPLTVSLAAGVVGYAMLAVTTGFMPLLLIAALPLGISSAAFPLLFALAKLHLGAGDRIKAERGIAILRASFSAAWGVGPAVGAIAVARSGYPGLCWLSAVFSLLAMLPLGFGGMRAGATATPESSLATRSGLSAAVWLAAGSLALFSMALGISAVALPVTLTHDLGGSTGAVGLSYSLCAFLEVPVMMLIAMRPGAFVGYRGMAFGFVAFVAHFVFIALASTVGGVLVSQVPRAVGIGFISCIGISYLQNMMPGRAGAAAALYANTGQVGALLAGLSAGLWAAHLGFHSLFWACVALAVGGLVLLDLGRRCRQQA